METGGLNGAKTVNRVEKLSSMVTDVTTEFAQLRSDNAILKVHIRDLQDLLAAQSSMEAAARTRLPNQGLCHTRTSLQTINILNR